MDLFQYRGGELYCEDVRAEELAERFGTPLYVYSAGTLIEHYRRVQQAFAELDPLICFSVKCCPNIHILRVLADCGSGFDVVSGGELHRALQAGGRPERIVFAGVGKTDAEIAAALDARIGLFNAESPAELQRLAEISAQRGVRPRIALRVNPDVDAHTHAYTTTGRKENKFGVPIEQAAALFEQFRGALQMCGIHLHIGSPVNSPDSYREAIVRGLALIDDLRQRGQAIDTIDIGGGFGAFYAGDEAPSAEAYARAIVPLLADRPLRVIIEPGRSIAANAGVLLARVLYGKDAPARRFVIVDASMNELIRPALYGAYHFIWPARAGERVPQGRGAPQPHAGLIACDVVGPVCESGDFLARDRALPPLQRGDLLVVFTTGAYAMAMASQYNSRPRAAEVLVRGTTSRLIRRRETYEDLVAAEFPGEINL